jgi:hypothetical protein
MTTSPRCPFGFLGLKLLGKINKFGLAGLILAQHRYFTRLLAKTTISARRTPMEFASI